MSNGKKQGGGKKDDGSSTPLPDDPNLTLEPTDGDDQPTEPDNQDEPKWR